MGQFYIGGTDGNRDGTALTYEGDLLGAFIDLSDIAVGGRKKIHYREALGYKSTQAVVVSSPTDSDVHFSSSSGGSMTTSANIGVCQDVNVPVWVGPSGTRDDTHLHAAIQAVYGSAALIPDTTTPSVPSGLTAGDGTAQSVLNWVASTDNVGVTGYDIYAVAHGSAAPTSGSTPSGSVGVVITATVTGLSAGSWDFYVRAKDAAGNKSAWSSVATATISAGADSTPPSQVTGLVATADNRLVTLSGYSATDNVGVDHYEYYMVASGGAAPTSGSTGTTLGAAPQNITGLVGGTAQDFYVRAVDAAGNKGTWSSVASATPNLTANFADLSQFDLLAADTGTAGGDLLSVSGGKLVSTTPGTAHIGQVLAPKAAGYSSPNNAKIAWTYDSKSGSNPNDNVAGLYLRANKREYYPAADMTGYHLQIVANGASSIVTMYRDSGGAATVIAAAQTITINQGDVISFEISGTTLKAKKNGVAITGMSAVTDATYSTGYVFVAYWPLSDWSTATTLVCSGLVFS